MNDALYIAATGLGAQQSNVETIANNLANVNTPGFKRAALNFESLMRSESAEAGQPGAAALPRGKALGVGVAGLLRHFEAGELRRTDAAMDLAVRGEGFLEVQLPDGTAGFVRGGTLMVTADGQLATAAGHLLRPGVNIGRDAKDLRIAADGAVSVLDAASGRRVEVGRLELVSFTNAGGLEPLGDGAYRASAASGEAQPAHAAENGAGSFAQGYVEASNVKLVDEMVNLMVAQRAYEMNVKVIQAADEMLGMSNNLRK
ncbi:flagellar basal-body rod protein FlgG [Methylibium rhizosphaerae]|uniref:flagellar basal-body rod protein FlgG n=1 Tax=Methylibium rhizosphaerae TaxID=2570323 RepID=UPI00112A09A7|nr:flagellar basal-body rod protein FlgG [Methylibium rhizosphaerae]